MRLFLTVLSADRYQENNHLFLVGSICYVTRHFSFPTLLLLFYITAIFVSDRLLLRTFLNLFLFSTGYIILNCWIDWSKNSLECFIFLYQLMIVTCLNFIVIFGRNHCICVVSSHISCLDEEIFLNNYTEHSHAKRQILQ